MIISLGITYTQFAILPTDSLSTNNSTSNEIQTWEKSVRTNGWVLEELGSGFLIVGTVLFIILTVIDRSKSKFIKSSSTVLFDEMYDGKDTELGERGYDAFSVKKLRSAGEPLQYDYSILKFVEENKMILITEDSENYGGCLENNIPCIKFGQNPSADEIIKELEKLGRGK